MLKALGFVQIFLGSLAINDIAINFALNKGCCNLCGINLYCLMLLITNLFVLLGGLILVWWKRNRIDSHALALLVGNILLGIAAITVSCISLWMVFRVISFNPSEELATHSLHNPMIQFQVMGAAEVATFAPNTTMPPKNATTLPLNGTTYPSNVTERPPTITIPSSNITTLPSNVTTLSFNVTTLLLNKTTVPLNVTTPLSNRTTFPANVTKPSSNVTILPSNVTMSTSTTAKVTPNMTTPTYSPTIKPSCIMDDCSSAVVLYALSCIVITLTFSVGILSFLAAYELGVIWKRHRWYVKSM